MVIQKSDVFDRLSILILKLIHGVEVENIHCELLELILEFKAANLNEAEVFINLLDVNSKIWNSESDIRKGKELDLEDVGRRALTIRDFNRQRIALKNSISQYKEIKLDHASE